MTPTGDPLDFVAAALSGLPRDPSRCGQQHLELLAEAAQGFSVHAERLRDAAAELEEGTQSELGEARLRTALRERAELARLEARTRLAQQRLDRYVRAALAAHNINLAALSGDDQTGEAP
jgi:hypothetical protein